MIITITGFPGSGNSTIARRLAEKLGYKHYSAGDMRRDMAREKGITLAELNKLGETESWTDIECDERSRKLGLEEDNFVIDAKTGYHFIPHSFKIWLTADLTERAKRIAKHKRKEETYKTIEEVKKSLKKRLESDKKRYKKYYDIETYTGKGFDFTLDTTNLTIEEVLDTIYQEIQIKQKDLNKY